MNLYGAYIGSQKASIVCAALNLTGVTWVREGDWGGFFDTEPDSDSYATDTAAAVANIPAALTSQGIASNSTVRLMVDNEFYPPVKKYCMPVRWGRSYTTALSEAAYNAKTQTAHTLRLDAIKAYGAGIKAGDHMTLKDLSLGWAQTLGHDDEPDAFAGAAVDLAWWYARIKANAGCVFAREYIKYNVGEGSTEARVYNWAYQNATYQIEKAVANGLVASDVVVYTWEFLLGGSVRPSAATLQVIYAALTAAGISHWVVAMGSVTTATELASSNVYLAGAVTDALGEGPASTPTQPSVVTLNQRRTMAGRHR